MNREPYGNLISQTIIGIYQLSSLQDILNFAVIELHQLLATDRVVICELCPDKQGLVVAEASALGWSSSLGSTIADPLALHNAAAGHGHLKIQAVEDIDEVLLAARYCQALEHYAVKSVLSTPLFLGRQCWGLLIAQHCDQVHSWQMFECQIADEVATHLAIAIDRALKIQHQQTTITGLEQTIQTLQEKNYQLKSLASHQNLAAVQKNAQLTNTITELEQTNQTLKLQTRKLEILTHFVHQVEQAQNLEDILQTTVAEVHSCLQVDRILIYRAHPEGSGKVIAEAVLPEWRATIGLEFSHTFFSQQCQRNLLQTPYKAIQDVVTAYKAMSPVFVQALADWNIRAKVVVPIQAQSEPWGFVIAHQCSGPRLWTDIELELLTQVATHVSMAVALTEQRQQHFPSISCHHRECSTVRE